MIGAKQLDILLMVASTPRKWEYMIVMEIILQATYHAFATISFPNQLLHPAWDTARIFLQLTRVNNFEIQDEILQILYLLAL